MKGIQGLIIAIGLGIVAAMFNWAYLREKSKNTEKVYFIGVADGKTIARGEVFTTEKLEKVGFPGRSVANLDDFAVHWDAIDTVVGKRSPRLIAARTLLLDQDLNTPAKLAMPDVDRIWIPVDTRTFVPSQVSAGDYVSFLVSAPLVAPPPADLSGEVAPEPDSPQPAAVPGRTRTIGPFLVLSLGNRSGKPETLRNAKIPQVQENVLAIKVTLDAGGNLDKQAQALWDVLQATNFRRVGVILHSDKVLHSGKSE